MASIGRRVYTTRRTNQECRTGCVTAVLLHRLHEPIERSAVAGERQKIGFPFFVFAEGEDGKRRSFGLTVGDDTAFGRGVPQGLHPHRKVVGVEVGPIEFRHPCSSIDDAATIAASVARFQSTSPVSSLISVAAILSIGCRHRLLQYSLGLGHAIQAHLQEGQSPVDEHRPDVLVVDLHGSSRVVAGGDIGLR